MIPALLYFAKCCLYGAVVLNALIVIAGLVWYWLAPEEVTQVEIESW